MKFKIFLSLFCFFTNVIIGEPNCLEVAKEEKKEEISLSEKKFQEWLEKRAKNGEVELNHYLSKYFPKVFSVRERFFSKMTPDGIAKGFEEIINMLSYEPWLYLEQLFKQISKVLTTEEKKKWMEAGYDFDALPKKFDNKNFKKWLNHGGGYWEFIVDQLSFYNEFLELAMVDLETNNVFLKKNNIDWDVCSDFKSFDSSTATENVQNPSLKKFWIDRGIQIHYTFYAFYFDFCGELFVEAILTQNLEDAYRFLSDLKIIMGKLTGSDYEAVLQKYIEYYKDLIEILKRKIQGEKLGEVFEEWMAFYLND